MCDNCVKAGRMTEAEAAMQREEFSGILDAVMNGDPQEIVSKLVIQTAAEEFTALVSELGYEFSIGRLENGNVAIGLVRKVDNAGPGYVLGEYSADNVRTMLEGN